MIAMSATPKNFSTMPTSVSHGRSERSYSVGWEKSLSGFAAFASSTSNEAMATNHTPPVTPGQPYGAH